MRICVPLGALFADSVEALDRAGLDDDPGAGEAVRAAGVPVVALAASAPDAEALAAADGWRWVARRAPEGYTVLDRVAGTSRTLARLEEVLTAP